MKKKKTEFKEKRKRRRKRISREKVRDIRERVSEMGNKSSNNITIGSTYFPAPYGAALSLYPAPPTLYPARQQLAPLYPASLSSAPFCLARIGAALKIDAAFNPKHRRNYGKGKGMAEGFDDDYG